MLTLKALLKEASSHIAPQEARWLLAHVLKCTFAQMIAQAEHVVAEDKKELFRGCVAARQRGEPLAYLLGTAPFLERDFVVSSAVLIPRPETEVLVSLVINAIKHNSDPSPIRFLELGTGSGIIAISVQCAGQAIETTATDLSKEALSVAQKNAQIHQAKIRFLEGSWYAPVANERFHIIASNPPYIAKDDPHLLKNGLPFEPLLALTDGHPDREGMAAICAIIEDAPHHLFQNGRLFLEHGYDQVEKVQGRLEKAGFSKIQSWQDEAGIFRVTGGVWMAS